jgi:hypothetical protein
MFRAQSTQVILDIYRELQYASQLLTATRLCESVSQQAFDQLASAAALKEDAGYSELPRFAERAALRTFNEIDKSGEHPSEEALKQRFTRNLVWELAERRCFAVTREGIMESTHRDHENQQGWEARIRDLVLGPCAALGKSLLSEEAHPLIRAPKRLFQPKPMTLETLTTPPQVLRSPQ